MTIKTFSRRKGFFKKWLRFLARNTNLNLLTSHSFIFIFFNVTQPNSSALLILGRFFQLVLNWVLQVNGLLYQLEHQILPG